LPQYKNILKTKYLKYGLELIFVVLLILGGFHQLEKRKKSAVYESDEVSWIYTDIILTLYFLRLDFLALTGKIYEAFDHPPLGKYIIGATLYLKGYTIDSLDPKRVINDNLPIVNARNFLIVDLAGSQSKNCDPFCKICYLSFCALSLLLIIFPSETLYGPFPAALSALLIISHPIFNLISTRILGTRYYYSFSPSSF